MFLILISIFLFNIYSKLDLLDTTSIPSHRNTFYYLSHSIQIRYQRTQHPIPTTFNQRNPRHLGTWTFRYWLGHLGTRYWTFLYWPGHLGTPYWTVRDLDETIFGTDHNCLVLINCQYFCTSSSLIYNPKVDRYVFLIIPV